MATQTIEPAHADVVRSVLTAINRSGEPMTGESLWKSIPKSLRPRRKPAFFELLEKSVADGSLWKFNPYLGKQHRFFGRPLAHYANQLILVQVEAKPATETELQRKIAKRLGNPSDAELRAMLDGMVGDGSLHRLPAKKPFRKVQYVARSTPLDNFFAQPVKGFRQKIDGIADVMAEAGIPRDAILQTIRAMIGDWLQASNLATTEPSAVKGSKVFSEALAMPTSEDDGTVDDRILEAIAELRVAGRSPLVSTAELRRSLELYFSDKAAFDRAILKLSEQDKVALHRHDYPHGLSSDERAALVTDGRDFFSGIALRP